jgi:hypothetical protein
MSKRPVKRRKEKSEVKEEGKKGRREEGKKERRTEKKVRSL